MFKRTVKLSARSCQRLKALFFLYSTEPFSPLLGIEPAIARTITSAFEVLAETTLAFKTHKRLFGQSFVVDTRLTVKID